MGFEMSTGRMVHWASQGEGAPVVALHGSASTEAQWRTLTGYLSGRFRVMTPDLAGYGRSARPLGPQNLATEAAFLRPVLDATGGPVHLIGHSFGGAVALAVAVMMPERVRSLTLIEPAAFRLLSGSEGADLLLAQEIAALAHDVRGSLRGGQREVAAARFIDYWNGSGAWARSSDRLRGFVLGALDRLAENFAALAAPGLTTRALARIACPTLVVAGLDSPLPALRSSEIVAGTIPGARFEIIAGAGHMAPLTHPHIVDPLIRRHLVAVDGARTAAAAMAA
jgi:lipase